MGIDGGAAPDDGTPHSLLKAVELAASTIADFAKAVSKYGKVIKGLVAKSKNHKNEAIIRALDASEEESGTCAGRKGALKGTAGWCRCNAKGTPVSAQGCKSKSPSCEWDNVKGRCLSIHKSLGAEGKLLRELLEESESDTGLWAAAERAVQDLRVQPPTPDKIKASLEAVVVFTKTKSKFGTAWAAYQVQLQAILRELGVLKVNFGKAFSYSLSAPVPPVAGFKLTPYIRASVNFDHDAPAKTKGGPPSLEISASMVVGMDYAARGSSGSVAEVAFSPVMDLDDGLQQDSLVPTISFLGSDPIPISSDPMVRAPFHVQIYV